MTEPSSTRQRITASPVKSVRLVGTEERPGDALLQITTQGGTQTFLVPRAALPKLADSLIAFASGEATSTVKSTTDSIN